jgi:hypothetical protein
MPQQEFEHRRTAFIKKKQMEEGIVAAKRDRSEPMIVIDAVAYYHTVFDKPDAPKRMTSVQYTMHSTIQRHLFKERIEWLDERGPVMGEVTFTRNMSAQLHLT